MEPNFNDNAYSKLIVVLDTKDPSKLDDAWNLVGKAKDVGEFTSTTNAVLKMTGSDMPSKSPGFGGYGDGQDLKGFPDDSGIGANRQTSVEPTPMMEQFSSFVSSLFASIATYFNSAASTVATKMTGLYNSMTNDPAQVDGEAPGTPETPWIDRYINDNSSGLTYGGAIGIGLAGSMLVFIVYKIVQKFRNKPAGQLETYTYAMNKSKGILTESLYLGQSVKNMYLKEDAGSLSGVNETLSSASGTAKELAMFLQEGPTETDGKIVSFLKKFAPFIKLCLLGIAAVAVGGIGYAAYASNAGDTEITNKPGLPNDSSFGGHSDGGDGREGYPSDSAFANRGNY